MMLVIDAATIRHRVVLSSSDDKDLTWEGPESELDLIGLIDWLKQASLRQAGDLLTCMKLELWLLHPTKVGVYRMAKYEADGGWVDLKPPRVTWVEFLQV